MIFAGCGCLVPGFLIVSTGAYFLQMVQQLVNVELAWTTLAKSAPYEESARGTSTGVPDDPNTPMDESRTPREFKLILGGVVPISTGDEEAYYFGRDVPTPFEKDVKAGPNALRVTVVKMDSSKSDSATKAPAGTPLHDEGKIQVKEEWLRVRWIPEMISDGVNLLTFKIPGSSGAGAAVWMRQSVPNPEDDEGTFDVVAFFQRPGSGDRIKPEEIRAFLEPFDLSVTEVTLEVPGATPK